MTLPLAVIYHALPLRIAIHSAPSSHILKIGQQFRQKNIYEVVIFDLVKKQSV